MSNASQYFKLAHSEEIAGNDGAALQLYLSSFCAEFNTGAKNYPTGTVSKIRRLQIQFSLSDYQLLNMVHSYGPLTDQECQQLLLFSIYGDVSGINTLLTGSAYQN